MTGFGSSSAQHGCVRFTVNIKSINSKQFDFILKLPAELKENDKENEIRQMIAGQLIRGKIECSVTMEKPEASSNNIRLNKSLIYKYYNELKTIAEEVGSQEDLLKIVMRMPEVIESEKIEMNSELWMQLQQAITNACEDILHCRENEGMILRQDFQLRIGLILQYLNEIEPWETGRIQQIRNRLYKSLTENQDQIPSFDANRLEQEIIFYLEKMDFTEEKVRLRKHCAYFLETMDKETQNGKKLGFISQEIGREINTLGSKAGDAEIQKLVVKMKDELEKIKEQLANIL